MKITLEQELVVHTFTVDAKQIRQLKVWLKQHDKDCRFSAINSSQPPEATYGGRISWHFAPTGIGVATTAMCACGEMTDLTDYSSW